MSAFDPESWMARISEMNIGFNVLACAQNGRAQANRRSEETRLP
jgi:hypothetical protein